MRLVFGGMVLAGVLVGCGGGPSNAVTVQCSDPASPAHADRDGDGLSQCQRDCDDADPNAYPGATELSDNDGYDQDCSTWTFTFE
ncbi:MAG: putative metal-binding motif-containing protein [Pseudomonadota bacterium]